jgi:3-oxoacyl-[acyl-carrier-protein] synthase II
MEKDMTEKLTQVVVTGVGHWRGEGLALIEAVEG